MQLADKVAAYSELKPNPYRKLSEVMEQWPIVGRGDMYYGGTTYENTQGLGVQLASGVERGEPVSLSWPQTIEAVSASDGSLVAVPVTILYDRGQTVLPSQLLHQRIPKPYVVLNPEDASRLSLREGERVQILVNGSLVSADLRQDPALMQGFVLVPRSLGIPVSQPVLVEIRAAEVEKV